MLEEFCLEVLFILIECFEFLGCVSMLSLSM